MMNTSAAAELHLKMCKKIAQLTKVIFQLNTRNEDNQAETEHIRSIHASELQKITQDAADKIKMLHGTLQTQTTATAQREHQYAAERQRLINEAKQQQQRTHASQVAAEEAFKAKVSELEILVKGAQDAYENRVKDLTQRAEAMKEEFENTSKEENLANKARLEELTIKHADEMKQLETISTSKYNKMLAEQLRLQEISKANLVSAQKDWEKQQQDAAAEHERQRVTQAVSAQTAFDMMKHDYLTKIEAFSIEMEALRANETMLCQENETLVKSQQEAAWTKQQLEAQMAKLQQDVLSERQDSAAHSEELQRMLVVSKNQGNEMAQEIETLKQSLHTREQGLVQTQREIETLQQEAITYKATASETQARLNQQLQTYEMQVVGLNHNIQAATEEIKAGQQQIQTLETELKATHNKMVTIQTDDARNTLKLTQELEAVQLKLQQAIIAHNQALEALEQTHKETLQQLVSTHTLEMEKHRVEAAKHLDQMEKQLNEASHQSLDATITALTRKHEEIVSEHDEVAKTLQAKLNKEIDAFKVQVNVLQSQVATGTHQLTALQTQHEELSQQLKSSQQQVSFLQSSNDALQLSTSKLQKERDAAHQKQLHECQSQHESVVESLSKEVNQIKQEHSNILRQMTQDQATRLQNITEMLESQRLKELSAQEKMMRELYEPQITKLQEQIKVVRLTFEASTEQAAEMQRVMDEVRRLEQEDFCSAMIRSIEQTVAERARAELEARQERDKLQLDHSRYVHEVEMCVRNEMQAQLTSLQAKADLDFARIVSDHRHELDTATQRHAENLKEMETTMFDAKERAIVTVKADAAVQLAGMIIKKDEERSEALLKAQTIYDKQYGEVRERLEATAESLTKKRLEWASAMQESQDLKAALTAKTEEMTVKVAVLEQKSREEIETIKAATKYEMDKLLEENLSETKKLSDQFHETQRVMLDQITELKKTIIDWQEKYARRESRSEDVAHIVELERLVEEKDALVQKTLDEMAYFKRELLNREEMYNKTFARSPNIGLLQVLKPHVQMQQSFNSINATQSSKARGKTQTFDPPTALQRRRSERSGLNASLTANAKVLPPLHNNQGS
ncbi:hypothetical protein Plhal304r1_c017g0062471 [Plasmopara halstedii]